MVIVKGVYVVELKSMQAAVVYIGKKIHKAHSKYRICNLANPTFPR
jgi:hypothetical protein